MAYTSRMDRIRGHQLIPQSLENSIPRLYSTDGQGSQVIVRAKFFTPSSSWTWYVTEYDPDSHICFGWVIDSAAPECAELGEFSLDELDQVRGPFGLPVERDLYFKPVPLAVVMAVHPSAA